MDCKKLILRRTKQINPRSLVHAASMGRIIYCGREFSGSFDVAYDPSDLGLVCLVKKQ